MKVFSCSDKLAGEKELKIEAMIINVYEVASIKFKLIESVFLLLFENIFTRYL